MTKLFYFLCLLCGVVGTTNNAKAQNVNILDVNFKNKLIQLGVDTNNDGQIQVSEAQAQTALNVSNFSISDMTGIEAFVNLTSLYCNNNLLVSLDLSNNTALTTLYCYTNQLISLNVSNNTALTDLRCNTNQLSSLDVLNNTALTNLRCDVNQLASLDISNNTALSSLRCGDNPLASLDVSNNTALVGLTCDNNQLTSLDVSNNTALVSLFCRNNQLTSLDLSNNIALTYFECNANQLTSLDVSNNPALASLYCDNNPLTSLDVSNNPALHTLGCNYNQFSSLDVSNNTVLNTLYCSNSPITTLFLKNGKYQLTLGLMNCPNLTYVCADDIEIANVQSKVPNALVSTFCTYAPGGNYNTLAGQTSLDFDMNGCTSADSAYPFSVIFISNGTSSGYLYSNQQGTYSYPLSMGNYSLAPVINPVYFSANNASISFPNDSNNTQIQDFCVTPNGSFPDVEITFIPLDPARPGFDTNYRIYYKNNGTTVANGDIMLNFQGNKMDFVNASISPTNQTTNQLTWTYNNLQPFESDTINITMNILPPPTNNIGEVLNFDANISFANDVNLSDNIANLNQTLVAAHDPNDKTCLEGHLLQNDKLGGYLHYLIRFQNTGNYPAENVIIVDTLDAVKYDLASLQIIETSHNAHIDLKANVLQFYFENIQLADSFSNEPSSHGFLVYKIKTANTMLPNSSVSNKAEIYFDYNLPIVTNLEITTFSDFLGIEDATQQPHFQCYPNPVQNTLTIETTKNVPFFMLNVIGETVKTFAVNGKENIDISNLPQGLYFLKAKGESKGVSIVKE